MGGVSLPLWVCKLNLTHMLTEMSSSSKYINLSIQHRTVKIIQSLLFPWFISIANSDCCVSKNPLTSGIKLRHMSQESRILFPLIQPYKEHSYQGETQISFAFKARHGRKRIWWKLVSQLCRWGNVGGMFKVNACTKQIGWKTQFYLTVLLRHHSFIWLMSWLFI